ncbi:MAG: DUF3108 domain-containing protein [Betaproteobacteria bacterium]|nr:DUF3108 domain-containing protein [Betaproteobacteria bacterium]
MNPAGDPQGVQRKPTTPRKTLMPRKPSARRARTVLIWAVVLSLLLHGLLLGGFHFDFPHFSASRQPLQVRMIALPVPPIHPLSSARPAQHIVRRHHVVRMIKTADQVQSAPVANAPPMPPTEPPPVQGAGAYSPAPVAPDVKPAPPVEQPQTTTLPAHFELQYHLLLGENGLPLGHASYVWIAEENRYTLVSITQAEGLLALFQPGRLEQISTGHIQGNDLVPDDFEIQRGSDSADKSTHIHIDYTQQQATITHAGKQQTEPLPGSVQDILSVIFQLALHPPKSGTMLLYVSSGKEFKPYHVIAVGEERINTPLGVLRTLHLSWPAESDENAMDVWLDEDHNNAPVKIRVRQQGLGTLVQVITGMQ